MLVFSNRKLDAGTTLSAAFTPGSDSLAAAQASLSGGAWHVVDAQDDIDDPDALVRLTQLFGGRKPVMLFVHGYNNPPGTCFDRLQALEKRYPGLEVLGFSWPSEGLLCDGSPLPGLQERDAGNERELESLTPANRTEGAVQDIVRRYRQAKVNAQDSIDAFARLLRLLATAHIATGAQPFSVAIHSLGAHMFQHTLQVEGATESLAVASNVVLLAPCVRAAGHSDWIERFRPRRRTYVTYNQGDSVLFGAYVADGEQFKLGTDPGPGLVQSDSIRYVSFTNSAVDVGGHAYFVDRVSTPAKKLFGRIFACAHDFEANEPSTSVYPIGCEPDGSVCYMAMPDPQQPPG
jgi:hypothetical protein